MNFYRYYQSPLKQNQYAVIHEMSVLASASQRGAYDPSSIVFQPNSVGYGISNSTLLNFQR